MRADAVDFRFDELHGELVLRHQVDFMLDTETHTGGLFNNQSSK